jgi:hypothetical protein
MRTDHLGGPITGGVTLTLGKYCPDKEKALPVERDSYRKGANAEEIAEIAEARKSGPFSSTTTNADGRDVLYVDFPTRCVFTQNTRQ